MAGVARPTRSRRADGPPSTEATAPEAQVAFHYESLLTVLRTVATAPTSGDALETLYAFLHAQYGLHAMALEVTSGPVTRIQPYGATEALTELVRADRGGAYYACVVALK